MNGLRLVGLVGEPPSIPRMFPERIFVKKSLGRRLKKLADRIICFSKACIKRKDFFLWKTSMEYGLIPSLLSLALLFWWRSVVLFKRTVEGVPTSKVKGVFYGLNEVKGSVQSNAPLQTYLTERPSVWYEWRISERWRKTETYRDKDGKRKTRTRSGWRTIDSGENFSLFSEGRNGAIARRTGRGKGGRSLNDVLHLQSIRSNLLWEGTGTGDCEFNSPKKVYRKFSDSGPRHLVLGPAKLREGVAQPMIAQSKEARYYFISTKSEAEIIRSRSIWALLIMLFSFLFSLAVPVVAISAETGSIPSKS